MNLKGTDIDETRLPGSKKSRLRQHGLLATHGRQRRVIITARQHGFAIAPHRLRREFSAKRPNEN